MASITIRNVEDDPKQRLRLRAAQHGRPMEEEARVILRAALAGAPQKKGGENLFERIHRRFAAVGGVELDLPPRERVRDPPTFD